MITFSKSHQIQGGRIVANCDGFSAAGHSEREAVKNLAKQAQVELSYIEEAYSQTMQNYTSSKTKLTQVIKIAENWQKPIKLANV